MFIKLFLFIGLLLNKSPILLFPGLGASKLVKGNLDIWPPKLFYFMFHRNEWINLMINSRELKTLEFGDKNSLDLHTNIPLIIKKNFYEDIMTKNERYVTLFLICNLLNNKNQIFLLLSNYLISININFFKIKYNN